METKRKKTCAICSKIDYKNRKDNHHIIPRHKGGLGKGRIWLCTECHTMLHIAESKGLCELPSKTNRKFIVQNSRTLGLMKRAVSTGLGGKGK